MTAIETLKKALKEKKLVLGLAETQKYANVKKLKEIVIAANTPNTTETKLNKIAELSKIKLNKTDVKNDELGAICKKPYSVSVVGILK